ncbi:glycosyltransferase [Pontibacter sp. E15-1]|uniref:glycosyltransferase family 4 protein n=1 Tax=Pontibacter sp. E15-1 TaxID=2919918 RepID=UPI001F4F5E64|nr:glycosyltransferase [Pontibacter sp. E15-1]MCJ8164437.1 glycosyltransferase [Pontibacter sp. E15-1]
MNVFLSSGSFFPAQTGGPSNSLYWHAKALVENDVAVTILTTNRGITEQSPVPSDKWTNMGFGDVRYCSSRYKAFVNSINATKRSDIIHLSSLFYFPSFLLAIYLYLQGRNWIWSPRGECSADALRYSSIKKKLILKLINRLKGRVVFHSTSPKETEEIMAVFGKVKVLEFPNYCSLEDRLAVDTKKQILFMGRIHPIKAIENLIQAVAMSEEFNTKGYSLKIVGKCAPENAGYLNSLKELVEKSGLRDKVHFAGHLTGKEKSNAYAESYCLVLPSHTENFGNVIIEALNFGTPVIASKNTPWGILEESDAGYHVSNQVSELADALNRIISLPQNQYQAMRENAFNLCEQHFSINNNIDKWIDAYKGNFKGA